MIKTIFKMLLLAICLAVTQASHAAPTAYALDQKNSEVGFVFKLNKSAAKGSMPVQSAKIVIDPSALQRSSVDVTLNVRRARAGFFFATEALKGASVLDAKQFGTIRFVSTAIRLNGRGQLADGAKIDGNLTIRGVTRPVTLNAALFRPKNSAVGDLTRLSFRINGALSRSAFGASGYPDLVDDEVQLDIVARVTR